jgi:hypothetical protein
MKRPRSYGTEVILRPSLLQVRGTFKISWLLGDGLPVNYKTPIATFKGDPRTHGYFISAEGMGAITWYVKEGDTVKPGQVLGIIRPKPKRDE